MGRVVGFLVDIALLVALLGLVVAVLVGLGASVGHALASVGIGMALAHAWAYFQGRDQ